MAEGRVAQIVRQGQGFGKILVQPQLPGDGAGDLGDLDGMGQPRPELVAFVVDEDLRLVLQPPEGGGMDDPVPVPLIGGARPAARVAECGSCTGSGLGSEGKGVPALAPAMRARQPRLPARLRARMALIWHRRLESGGGTSYLGDRWSPDDHAGR